MSEKDRFEFQEIGRFYCDESYRYDTPRQGVFANDNIGYIELEKGKNFEQALEDLAGVQRIWLIFVFNQNSNWKAKVTPPVAPNRKIGLFATRSPHRPNPIGLSCVELVKIDKLKIYVKNFDLLNNSPILDIKPYISVADSFIDSEVAWLDDCPKDEYQLEFSQKFTEQSNFIYQNSKFDIKNFCLVQLSINPFDKKRKRVVKLNDNCYQIGFRTWRINFSLLDNNIIKIENIESNYTKEELDDLVNDIYKDKELHRAFVTMIASLG